MRRVENPEVRRLVIKYLADRYEMMEDREPNHLSSLVYCRTKAFLQYKGAARPTDDEVMMFATGYGLQDVMTPKGANTPLLTKDGVVFRPDAVFTWTEPEQLTEMKSTRRTARKHLSDEAIPVPWIEYMMGGCYIAGKEQYELIVLYLMGNYAPPFPDIMCDTFYFDTEEIHENWFTLMERKAVIDAAVEVNVPPTPFEHCADWECDKCRHTITCQAIIDMMYRDESYESDEEEE